MLLRNWSAFSSELTTGSALFLRFVADRRSIDDSFTIINNSDLDGDAANGEGDEDEDDDDEDDDDGMEEELFSMRS